MFHPNAKAQFIDPLGSIEAFRSLFYFYPLGWQGYIWEAQRYVRNTSVRNPPGKHPSLQIHIAGSELISGWGTLGTDIVTFNIVTTGDTRDVYLELNSNLGVPHYADTYYPLSLCCPIWNGIRWYYMDPRTTGVILKNQYNAAICESILRLAVKPDMNATIAESILRQLWSDILAEPVLTHIYPLVVVVSGYIGQRKAKLEHGKVADEEQRLLELNIIGVYSIPQAMEVYDWFKMRFPGGEHTHMLLNFLGNLRY